MEQITTKQAYLAMFEFLERYYEITKSNTLGSMLGSMSLLKDGKTADPGVWEEWMEAIEKAKSNDIDAQLTLQNNCQQ